MCSFIVRMSTGSDIVGVSGRTVDTQAWRSTTLSVCRLLPISQLEQGEEHEPSDRENKHDRVLAERKQQKSGADAGDCCCGEAEVARHGRTLLGGQVGPQTRGVVGDTGLEPVTSCMSSKCSNQLS